MKKYYYPPKGDLQIISGESGAAGLAALLALSDASLSETRERLGLDSHSRILLFNTEGDTDPENFQRVVSSAD
jgi:diaminopropionate ammonia-lyase